MKPGPLNIAVAGAGMISWYHLTGWRKLGDRVRIVGICDPDRTRGEKRAQEFGIPRVYQDAEAMFAKETIDALDVITPRETHAGWVDAGADRGIDVLCQKPLTPTLAESEALVRRVDTKSRLMAHENWRFRPWYRELKRWIAAGELGEIQLARMSTFTSGLLPDAGGHRPLLVREPYTQYEQRLMIAEVLIHHLDVMRFLCGELRVVAARGAKTVADVVGETVAAIFLETAAGVPVEVMGSLAAAGYSSRPPDRLEIVGSEASVMFDDCTLTLRGPAPRTASFDAAAGYQASFDGVIAHFVDCLETGAPFETNPADNLETLRLVEHAYWAAGLQRATPRT
jgi:predicted dehydrogenase